MRDELKRKLANFTKERDWDQFHSPENLAKSIVIEAAELLEHFQWDGDADLEGVKEELADVLIYSELLAQKYNLDTDEIVEIKISKNEEKYPVDKAKGSSKKYTEFEDL